MADVYQRLLGEPLALDPGQWTRHNGRVAVCCKKCGSINTLAQSVDQGGFVERRYRCLTVTCGYDEYLLLADWGVS